MVDVSELVLDLATILRPHSSEVRQQALCALQAMFGIDQQSSDSPKRRPDLYSATWRKIRTTVLAEQGTTCRYCGVDCSDDPTVDHIRPVCSGVSPFEAGNFAVSCRRCNSVKGGREGWQKTP